MVRIVTRLTLIPAYLAVFSDSPTTVISYPCLEYFRYTYISTIIINEFRLTYGKLGPTEVRLILIAINTLFIYTPWTELHYELWGRTYGLFDFIGFVIACILFLLYVVQLVQDLRDLDKKDPLKPYHKE
mgnify:CR=1 FL=1